MTDFEKRKKEMENYNDIVEIFEAYDTTRKIDCLVISYWDCHTHIEEIFDVNGKYLATEEENDWDYLK